MARVIESDLCILGGGITAAMAAQRITEAHDVKVVVVEAGDKLFNLPDRFERRRRFLEYSENPWPNDHIPDQTAHGIQSRSMVVGGLALHWGGTCPRFTPEDFRLKSLYGVARDWPLSYDDLEPFYVEAEERIGVAGVPGPPDLDVRSKPYPMPNLPLSYNLALLKEWAEKSGIPFWPNPVAKNSVPYHGRNICARCDTCNICPTGAKYSPDFTFQELLAQKRIDLLTRTLVRKLVPEPGSGRIESAVALDRDHPEEPVELRAKVFVLALGYAWSAHLLLLSGIGNRSGLVGKYVAGHRPVNATAEVPMKLYPGIYEVDSLLSKKFQRPGKLDRYVRHDLRIWESRAFREPRLKNEAGEVLLGDAVLEDWRARSERGTARLRAYYDVLPARESALTLDPEARNRWGDPMPRIDLRDSDESKSLRGFTENRIRGVFESLVRAGGGKLLSVRVDEGQDHPAGGCVMGDDPESSVVDSFGRAHGHENLFVVGAPTMPTAGCANGTLTFVALTLRSAAEFGKAFPRRAQAPVSSGS